MAHKTPVSTQNNANGAFFFLCLYTITIFIRPHEWSLSISQYFIEYPIARYFLILSFMGYLLTQRPKIWGPQSWFLLGILIIVPISGIRNGWIGGGITQAQNFFIYALLPFLLYAGLVNTKRKQHWVLLIFVIACAIMLHHGFSQFLSPDGIGWSGQRDIAGRIRYLGFFNDPNDLGMFFVMNIPILFYLKNSTENPLFKLICYSLIIGLIFGIYLTNSRGSLLGLLSLLLLFGYFKFSKIKFFLSTLTLLPVVFFIISKFRTIDTEEASADGRIQAWYEGIQMFKQRPIFGVGKGGFMDHHDLTAHNSYVLIMAELGTLGYVLWLSTLLLTVLMLYRIFNLSQEKYKDSPSLLDDMLFAKCLFFSFVGFLTTSFFLSRSYVVFLYIFIGLACGLFYRAKKEAPEIIDIISGKNIGKLMLFSLFSLIGLYVIIIILL